MDYADWAMLVSVSIYGLFNIKKIYYLILYSWGEIGAKRTLAIIGFFAIWVGIVFCAFFASQYFWIFRVLLICYIIGFFIYRFVWGTRYYDKEG